MSSGFSPAERDIYAVLDSADSDVPVCAPADRNAARRLKTAHTFHCSTALGGCGTELTFATGDINIPHFRHRAGVRCALMGSGSITDRYTHLAIQNALRDWIIAMPGFTCQLEVSVEDGRTDVLATGPDFEAALEVQRSQLSGTAARDRTSRYRTRAPAVDWLFESTSIDAFKAEMAERGWSLRVWWGWAKQECRIGVSYQSGDETEPEERAIGGALDDWLLTPGGLDSEHLRKAKQAVADRQEALRRRSEDEAAEAAEQAADKRAREAAARRAALAEDLARVRHYEAQLQGYSVGVDNRWPAKWPVLQGTPKQVRWAAGLRAKVVGFLHEELANNWLNAERGYPVAQWLSEQESAKFWIEHLKNVRDVIDLLRVHEYRG
ncbi:competence protein CoiA family protein [Arthrobacter globiformis]|uniref:competence protein CoiA family protein n=1 Tax=Arthrobacter globiformis TaxID=1665 RepID=UPI002781A427|nr:competence protein CoiA family protein [Arthrobacter globiformis]MDQ0863510.1 hypothetical protein [Arthrobacter globiformis]